MFSCTCRLFLQYAVQFLHTCTNYVQTPWKCLQSCPFIWKEYWSPIYDHLPRLLARCPQSQTPPSTTHSLALVALYLTTRQRVPCDLLDSIILYIPQPLVKKERVHQYGPVRNSTLSTTTTRSLCWTVVKKGPKERQERRPPSFSTPNPWAPLQRASNNKRRCYNRGQQKPANDDAKNDIQGVFQCSNGGSRRQWRTSRKWKKQNKDRSVPLRESLPAMEKLPSLPFQLDEENIISMSQEDAIAMLKTYERRAVYLRARAAEIECRMDELALTSSLSAAPPPDPDPVHGQDPSLFDFDEPPRLCVSETIHDFAAILDKHPRLARLWGFFAQKQKCFSWDEVNPATIHAFTQSAIKLIDSPYV